MGDFSGHSAVRETRTTLWYLIESGLVRADFPVKFERNNYSGEKQMKLTEEVSGETFRKKRKQRLVTQQSMPWNEIRRRAATTARWHWHRPDAL